MRIAFLLSSLRFGGAERVTLNLAKALSAMGFNIDVLVMSREGEFLDEAERLYNVVDLACDRTWKLPRRLSRHLAHHGADILISGFWKLNLCASLAALQFPTLRLLLWEHSPPSQSKNSPNHLYAVTASILYRRATKIICVSSAVKGDVAKLTIGLDSKLMVIYNPIPGPGLGNEEISKPGAPRRIAWVGRLAEPKNPELMLEIFSLLKDRIDAELIYVGDGPLRLELERRCSLMGLTDRVRFKGFVPNPYEVLRTVDLLALTSDREGFGNVLIEALHCGLPVVSTDCSEAIHEILRASEYGSIVPKRDARAFAEAIIYELTHPRDPDRQVHGASQFKPEVIATRVLTAAGVKRAQG